MEPQHHIFYGLIFSLLILVFYKNIFAVSVIFLSSFLIDVDHYLVYYVKFGSLSLRKSIKYFQKLRSKLLVGVHTGENVKAPLMIFHTIEFLILVGILAFFSKFFLFLLAGFLFHSWMDMADILKDFKTLRPREFSVIHYLVNQNNPKIRYF